MRNHKNAALRLEDTRHRLEDRLEDNPFLKLSTSLYCVYNVRVTAKLEDMEDFFSYTNTIAYSSAPLSSR